MKKRVFTIFCAVVLLAAALSASALQASAATDDFQVGFARVDINPYVEDGKFSSGIMELPLSGNGDVWNRLSSGLIDDNGDGKVTADDGLSANCIAVSDADGKTVLLIAVDLIDGYLGDKVRKAIVERVDQAVESGELTNAAVTYDRIYYAGSHTHNAPDVPSYSKSGKTGKNNAGKDLSVINSNLGIWIDRTIEDIAEAAVTALKDRASAKLVKDSISVSDDTKSPVSGKTLNTVRHYVNQATGEIAGDNFNSRGSNPKQVTQVNDTLYMLKFDFSEHNQQTGDSKLPIILANWRGHATTNNVDLTSGKSSRTCLSSDYFNAFRYALEFNCTTYNNGTGTYSATQKYRVALFNGEGGNVNTWGREVTGGKAAGQWISDLATANNECRGNAYGRILSALAKHGLDTTSDQIPVASGRIKTMRYDYHVIQNDSNLSNLAYQAAKSFQSKSNPQVPYVYKNSQNEVFVIGSRYQANYLIERWKISYQRAVETRRRLELNTVMLGDGVAFVTISGEPFDYYYNPDGSNAWKNIIDNETYGRPFVLGYCNGSLNYVPNSRAYEYNAGSTIVQTGSYEAAISYVPKGTGENMIEIFGKMLQTSVNDEDTGVTRYCEHCNKTVSWRHYNGQDDITGGHYYLMHDVYATISPGDKQKICLDLAGYTVKGVKRAIDTEGVTNTVVSVMDSSAGQTGKVLGCGGEAGSALGYAGNAALITEGNVLNWYGGTLGVYERKFYSSFFGGTAYIKGEMNVYGGTIDGGVASSFSGQYLNSSNEPVDKERVADSGTICVDRQGTLRVFGGEIKNGRFEHITGRVNGSSSAGYIYSETITEGTGTGPCVRSLGNVILGGDAKVDQVYFSADSATRLLIDTSAEPFTGSVELDLPLLTDDTVTIGMCTPGTVLPENAVTIAGTNYPLIINGDTLQINSDVGICDGQGNYTAYTTMEKAMEAYVNAPAGSYIRLAGDYEEDLTVTRNIYLDLNGYSITGDVTVLDDCVLYCMDSATDDYTIADGDYGQLTGNRTGVIMAVPANTVSVLQEGRYRDGYIAIQETSGLSFHRVKIRVTTISLRPSVAGVYYTGAFGGDELVVNGVTDFGTAYSVVTAPQWGDGTSLWVKKESSEWTNDGTVTSVLLKDVMKEDAQDNAARAQMPIYGRAYVRTAQGFLYSDTVVYSLQELTEAADDGNLIHGTAMDHILAMYDKYADVMSQWDIPGILSEMDSRESGAYLQNRIHLEAEKMTEDNVFGAGGEITAKCPVCGTEEVWVDINSLSSMYSIPAGHYYLSSSVENSNQYAFSGDSCFHLNGCDITSSARAIVVNEIDTTSHYTLNIMGEGTVSGAGYSNSVLNRGTLDLAGVANLYGGTYIATGAKPVVSGRGYGNHCALNIYAGASVVGRSTNNEALIRVRSCDVNIYGGTVSGGPAGNIRAGGGTSTITVHGGTVANGGGSVGGNIYAEKGGTNGKVTVVLSGGKIIGGDVYIASDVKSLTVSGRPTISNLDLTSGIKLALGEMKKGASVGITAADGEFTEDSEMAEAYLAYFKAVKTGKCVKVEGNTLVIADA